MIKMITVPNVTRNTNITAVFIFHVERGEAEEAKRRMCNVKRKLSSWWSWALQRDKAKCTVRRNG